MDGEHEKKEPEEKKEIKDDSHEKEKHTEHEKKEPEGHKEHHPTHHKSHHEHKEHEHKHHTAHHKKPAYNIWKIVSAVLIVLLIITFYVGYYSKGGADSNVKELSEKEASEKVMSYIKNNLIREGMDVELISISEAKGVYSIKIEVDGEEVESYMTKDAGLFFIQGLDMTKERERAPEREPTTPASPDIPKQDKPEAELYIFSYCPAGSSTLDSFAEAGKVLKDVADLKVKFFSEMHGQYEKQQNIIQECIQKVDYDNYWDYAAEFLGKVYNVCGRQRDVGCDKTESIKLMKEVGIDSDAVFKCVDEEGEAIYASEKRDASNLRLQYSPSVVINGVYLQNADRSPEGIKTLICDAFNEVPEECSKTIGESEAASSGSC